MSAQISYLSADETVIFLWARRCTTIQAVSRIVLPAPLQLGNSREIRFRSHESWIGIWNMRIADLRWSDHFNADQASWWRTRMASGVDLAVARNLNGLVDDPACRWQVRTTACPCPTRSSATFRHWALRCRQFNWSSCSGTLALGFGVHSCAQATSAIGLVCATRHLPKEN